MRIIVPRNLREDTVLQELNDAIAIDLAVEREKTQK